MTSADNPLVGELHPSALRRTLLWWGGGELWQNSHFMTHLLPLLGGGHCGLCRTLQPMRGLKPASLLFAIDVLVSVSGRSLAIQCRFPRRCLLSTNDMALPCQQPCCLRRRMHICLYSSITPSIARANCPSQIVFLVKFFAHLLCLAYAPFFLEGSYGCENPNI